MRRILLAFAAAFVIPATLTVALPAGSAFAATPTIVTCTKLIGSATTTGSTGTATGCNHTTITGGSGKQTSTTATSTFKITWKTGKTTKGKDTTTVVTPSKCPTTFKEEIKAVGTVTGGTATPLIGGKATSLFCVNTTTGKFELLPGTTYKV